MGRRMRDGLRKWVADRAVAVESLLAGSPSPDLAPLAAVLPGVRVVGLGEPSHGSRDVHLLKARLSAYLVEEHGLTQVAFEASTAAWAAVDDSVAHGGSRGRAAVRRPFAAWAQNGHTSCTTYGGGAVESTGVHLRRTCGDTYLALSVLAGRGEFRAHRISLLGRVGPEPVVVRTAAPASRALEHLMEEALPFPQLLVLRGSQPPPRAAAALAQRWPVRESGAVVGRLGASLEHSAYIPAADIDALVYLPRSRPTRPLRVVGHEAQRRRTVRVSGRAARPGRQGAG